MLRGLAGAYEIYLLRHTLDEQHKNSVTQMLFEVVVI